MTDFQKECILLAMCFAFFFVFSNSAKIANIGLVMAVAAAIRAAI